MDLKKRFPSLFKKNYILPSTISENPNNYCENCHDTGWYGDLGPGIKGNREYAPCECSGKHRARRIIKRRGI